MLNLIDEEKFWSYREKMETKSQNKSIKDLNNDLISNNVIINPIYQREYILTEKEASKYVESVFMGCVIPELIFYAANEDESIYEVFDGRQRLTSLIDFYNNKYFLSGLEDRPILNGYYYKDLDKRLQDKFNNYLLNIRICPYVEDINYKINMFERINNGTNKLKPQEIRNSVFYQTNLIKLSKDMTDRRKSKNKNFFKVADKIDRLNDKHFAVQELVLRLLSEKECFPNIKNVVSNTIDNFLIDNENLNNETCLEIEKEFFDMFSVLGNLDFEKFSNVDNKLQKGTVEAIYLSFSIACNLNKVLPYISIIEQNIENVIKSEDVFDSKKMKEKTNTAFVIISKVISILNGLRDLNIDIFKIEDIDTFIERLNNWNIEKKKSFKRVVVCTICNKKINSFEDMTIIPNNMVELYQGRKCVHKTCNSIFENKVL